VFFFFFFYLFPSGCCSWGGGGIKVINGLLAIHFCVTKPTNRIIQLHINDILVQKSVIEHSPIHAHTHVLLDLHSEQFHLPGLDSFILHFP